MDQVYSSLGEAIDVAGDLGFFFQAREAGFSGEANVRLSANPEDRNDPRLAWVRKEGAKWRLTCTSAAKRMLRGAA